ncbi:MAG: hypothetical protein WDN66_03690 [Candidatus Saccharibacteria bacterium]
MDKEIENRMKEVGEVVKTLDESVRPVAFQMMQGYIVGEAPIPSSKIPESQAVSGDGSIGDFFEVLEVTDPANAVRAITAYLFKEYGASSFTPQEVKDIANEVGLTVPERVDMTLRSAKKSGKALYRSSGRGKYAPTVHGEKAFKDEYGVKKGTKSRPIDDKK